MPPVFCVSPDGTAVVMLDAALFSVEVFAGLDGAAVPVLSPALSLSCEAGPASVGFESSTSPSSTSTLPVVLDSTTVVFPELSED